MSSQSIVAERSGAGAVTRHPAASATLALVGRLGLSTIFIVSGVGKVMAPAATIGFIASVGLPLPHAAYAGSLGVELLGGLALLLGFRVRWAAAVLAVFCLATAFSFHAHFADQNQLMHFLKNIAIAGGMLQVVALGGGRFSLDARRMQ
jgi:putative oxidoreductase